MKTFNTILKVLAVLAAIAGAVYVTATYGDKIVAGAKKLLGKLRFGSECCCCEDEDCCCCCEEDCAEELADEEDFEG